jgi:Methane oxygenase PmoA
MVDDAANPRHPTTWFARSEHFACLCPAPFFDEELPLPDGETLRFRYAVVVAAGDRGDDGSKELAEAGRSVLAV